MMHGRKFASVLNTDSDDSDSGIKLIRISTTSFKDKLHDRSKRLEGQEQGARPSASEDKDDTVDFESVTKSWEQDAVNRALPLAASAVGNLRSVKGSATKRKQKKDGKGETSASLKKPKKRSPKQTPLAFPKTYATLDDDLTYIPPSMALALPSIEWKNAVSEGVKPANILESNSFHVTGVLGRGKGTEKSLPKYEFDSLWQYIIPSKDAKDNEPWILDPAAPPDDIKLKFLSVVSCVSLGIPLDLELVAQRGFDLHYLPDSFTPVVMRLKSPAATAMLFKSGKMVLTGTKTERDNQVAVYKVARRLRRMGFPVRPLWCQIQNLTATCNLGFRVRVHLLAKMQGVASQYHPELFTGVTITFTIPRAKAILFRTGSILITGVKSEKEAASILAKVYPLAKLYSN